MAIKKNETEAAEVKAEAVAAEKKPVARKTAAAKKNGC